MHRNYARRCRDRAQLNIYIFKHTQRVIRSSRWKSCVLVGQELWNPKWKNLPRFWVYCWAIKHHKIFEIRRKEFACKYRKVSRKPSPSGNSWKRKTSLVKMERSRVCHRACQLRICYLYGVGHKRKTIMQKIPP